MMVASVVRCAGTWLGIPADPSLPPQRPKACAAGGRRPRRWWGRTGEQSLAVTVPPQRAWIDIFAEGRPYVRSA